MNACTYVCMQTSIYMSQHTKPEPFVWPVNHVTPYVHPTLRLRAGGALFEWEFHLDTVHAHSSPHDITEYVQTFHDVIPYIIGARV